MRPAPSGSKVRCALLEFSYEMGSTLTSSVRLRPSSAAFGVEPRTATRAAAPPPLSAVSLYYSWRSMKSGTALLKMYKNLSK